MKKIAVAWIILILALVALMGWIGAPDERPKDSGNTLISSKFSLVGADDKPVTDADFRGRYLLVFFGFTHCPSLCPTTLLLMQNAVDQLGAAGKNVQPLFISVDPERDTPAIAAQYASRFGRTIGLSGSPEQVKAAADSFKVYYSKVPMDDPDLGYMIDHSGYIFLMGPNGKYLAHFAASSTEKALEDGLRKFIR